MDSTKKNGVFAPVTRGADPSPQHVVSQSCLQSILLWFGMAGRGGDEIFFWMQSWCNCRRGGTSREKRACFHPRSRKSSAIRESWGPRALVREESIGIPP